MVTLLAAIIAALSLGPTDATRLACRLERYEPCSEILAILAVESRGLPVGAHVGHHARVSGAVFWRAAVKAKWLHPESCARHQQTDGGVGWGIVGPHGLAAAYSVRHLGECVGPEATAVPLLSAVMTIRRLREMARRYGLRTVEARAETWRRGVGHEANK
jgi:hypothetical protein